MFHVNQKRPGTLPTPCMFPSGSHTGSSNITWPHPLDPQKNIFHRTTLCFFSWSQFCPLPSAWKQNCTMHPLSVSASCNLNSSQSKMNSWPLFLVLQPSWKRAVSAHAVPIQICTYCSVLLQCHPCLSYLCCRYTSSSGTFQWYRFLLKHPLLRQVRHIGKSTTPSCTFICAFRHALTKNHISEQLTSWRHVRSSISELRLASITMYYFVKRRLRNKSSYCSLSPLPDLVANGRRTVELRSSLLQRRVSHRAPAIHNPAIASYRNWN